MERKEGGERKESSRAARKKKQEKRLHSWMEESQGLVEGIKG